MELKPLNETLLPQAEAIEALCFSLPWSAAMFLPELSDDACFWICALEGETLLGYAGMKTVLDEGYISNVAVSPTARRRGIANRLMEALREEAERRKLRFLTLEVRESNEAAIALYRRHGYTLCGRRPNYYALPTEAALLMTLYFHDRNDEPC